MYIYKILPSKFIKFLDAQTPHISTEKLSILVDKVLNLTANPLSQIAQDSEHRFVTDTEKAVWSAKQNALGYEPEDISHKEPNINLGGNQPSDIKYPTQRAIKGYLDNLALDSSVWTEENGIITPLNPNDNLKLDQGVSIAKEHISTTSGNVIRENNYISQVVTDTRTVTFTRDESNFITFYTDDTRTWAITRDTNNRISSWSVS